MLDDSLATELQRLQGQVTAMCMQLSQVQSKQEAVQLQTWEHNDALLSIVHRLHTVIVDMDKEMTVEALALNAFVKMEITRILENEKNDQTTFLNSLDSSDLRALHMRVEGTTRREFCEGLLLRIQSGQVQIREDLARDQLQAMESERRKLVSSLRDTKSQLHMIVAANGGSCFLAGWDESGKFVTDDSTLDTRLSEGIASVETTMKANDIPCKLDDYTPDKIRKFLNSDTLQLRMYPDDSAITDLRVGVQQEQRICENGMSKFFDCEFVNTDEAVNLTLRPASVLNKLANLQGMLVTSGDFWKSQCEEIHRNDVVLYNIAETDDTTKMLWVPGVVMYDAHKLGRMKIQRTCAFQLCLLVFDAYKMEDSQVTWYPSLYRLRDCNDVFTKGHMLRVTRQSLMATKALKLPAHNIKSFLTPTPRMPSLYVSLIRDLCMPQFRGKTEELYAKYTEILSTM